MAQLHNRINKKQLKSRVLESSVPRTTLSFYRYHPITDPVQFRDELYRKFVEKEVLGRVYVAREGINAQVSVPTALLPSFREALNGYDILRNVRLNKAVEDDGRSFYVLKIKVKTKIVADGLQDAGLDISQGGKHIDAKTFNELTDQNQTVIVDMRNHYESEVGHFKNAICPDVETFKESLTVVEELIEPHRDKDIVMYCTGGIRCEKATAYFRSKGFERLYQLDGGIIEYKRQVEAQNMKNKFVGKNFVFDERLGERISSEVIAQCHQCGDACDSHTNCANDACHLLFIQCDACSEHYEGCCSQLCKDFTRLPKSEQERLKKTLRFNGTKFGKGRYKAHHQRETLEHK